MLEQITRFGSQSFLSANVPFFILANFTYSSALLLINKELTFLLNTN